MTTFDKNKPSIFLDLDQTLISAEVIEEYDFEKYKRKARKFTFEDMDGYYIIFERPYLQKFLDYLFANFNVSIWTAASKDYAIFVINKFIIKNHPNRKLQYVFFSYHTDLSINYTDNSKDLSVLWNVFYLTEFDRRKTFILDDYEEVYQSQPSYCIIAPPFEFKQERSENDDFLKKLIPKLKKMKKLIDKDERNPISVVNT